jgi:hypothetical protein
MTFLGADDALTVQQCWWGTSAATFASCVSRTVTESGVDLVVLTAA